MIEIKFVGHGGQGSVVAGKLLGVAAGKRGYRTQSFASFGYSKRGGVVESYVRIAEETIHIHTKMYEPDYLILMSEALAQNESYIKGLKRGGTILINSPLPPERFPFQAVFKVCTVGADEIALQAGLKLPSGLPIINSAILGAIIGLIPFDCLEELSAALSEAGIPALEKNLEASREAYRRIKTAARPISAMTPGAAPVPEERFPHHLQKTPPCEFHCPAGHEIGKTISLLRENRIAEAYQNILAANPFPGTCGRVCFHPCESECNRMQFDEGVAIQGLERAVSDHVDRTRFSPPARKPRTGRKAAVVGSGPAGLTCAYFLCLWGHDVTVFEALPIPGGIPKVCIPPYRLDREVVEREIRAIVELGVEVRTGVRVGVDIPFKTLMDRYDACFVASGAQKTIALNIPGEGCRGVSSGLDLLRDVALGKRVELGRRVAVIGGGNTAIDAARTSKRLGAGEVTLFYRRPREAMPAYRSEVEAAEKEGIRIMDLATPVRIHAHEGRAVRLECARIRMEEPGEDGRPRPVPVPGTLFTVDVDQVIAAVGERIDDSFLPEGLQMDQGLVKVDSWGRTSLRGIYAGGDLISSQRSVVAAIGSGKRAATGMDMDLMAGREFVPGRDEDGPSRRKDVEIVPFSRIHTAYFKRAPRLRRVDAPVIAGILAFNEPPGWTLAQAVAEAGRCFQCGRCTLCGNCYTFCPDAAVTYSDESFRIRESVCKRCGICIEECPRDAIAWKGGAA